MLYKMSNVITGAGAEASRQDEGTSLTSVLETPALRVELALLVLLCTDAMRSDLIATFDPNKTHETSSSTATPVQSPKPTASPARDLISFDAPEDEAATASERARLARKQEVESTQMLGLRRAALTFFDKWRAGVMHRVCDVLCVRGEVVRQAKMKRKQMLDDTQRQKEGNSLLIDFGGDPFGEQPQARTKHGHYDVVQNKLNAFDEPKRVLILHCILLLLLSLENYPAHSRVLLLHLAGSLELEVDVLAEHEKSVAQGLLASAASQMDAEESAKRQAANDSASRRWKVGLAAVGGAVLIGVTGGLAAPLLAAGVGTVMGGLGLGATVISGYLGALAGSSVLVGSLFGAYGAKMTGKLMKQYAREVDDFEFIPIQDPDRPIGSRDEEWAEDRDARDPTKREQHRLRVTIGVSGWLNSPSDVNKPWEVIDAAGTEAFALRFEMDSMLRLGNSLNDVLFSYAWDGVTYTVVSRTLLGALYAGLWPLGLVKAASVLDNPFSVALARADKAGKVLARALMDRVQGERPVTLVGYSIGARVIYACLVELAEQNAFGLVESVCLMGAPVPSNTLAWRKLRSVVAARVVNVYSTEDYILGFLYRSAKFQMGVAGLQEVQGIYGIENVNMSKLVTGHDRYRYLVGTILIKVGFGDVDYYQVAEQERALEMMERKKEQAQQQAKRRKQEPRTESSKRAASETTGVQEIAKPKQEEKAVEEDWADWGDEAHEQPAKTPSPAPQPHHTPPPDNSTSSHTRRQFMNMSSSGQQPQRSYSQLQNTIQPSHPELDPLSGSIMTEAIPARQSTFPAASRHNRQIPSNMVPTPPAPPQHPARRTSTESEDGKIVMQDLDDHKSSPPQEQVGRSHSLPSAAPQKKAASVSIAAVEVEDEDDDEVSSQFGELSMVEPMPLEEGDLGLV
ncbi:hypothetical protein BDV96DRAFT_137068 [Lophiotrema nucula]|uniref:DUF726-domain-containing protein n=1 Tax=Lophiotrema nucula TaxID=690887 RepID=A0A6A5ZQY8_9PLEO|nr:hypothetical protein BDV96DRAFT_137068 [Lophiotrema nucula]